MTRESRTTAPQRRSPIKRPPLRTAGQSLREQMFDLLFDRWLSYALALAVVWLLVVLDWLRLALRVRWSWKSCLALTSFAAAFSVLAYFRMRGTDASLKNLRLGLEGEVAVGQFLDEYCRERGYKVLHDLQGDGFNVDHVLIGPGGIFAIDTKTHSKPTMGDPVITYDGDSVLIDGQTPDRDPIKQAKASARFVAELLAESTNRPASKISVRPVVLYPGWFVDGTSSGREVWALNPKAFVSFLDNEVQHLSDADIGLFHSRLKMQNRF